MIDPQAGATKQDIQMLQNDIKMVVEAMSAMENRLEGNLKDYIDDRFEQMQVHTGAMIEHAEERFLATGHDKLSMHDDKLENHEGRIIRVETAVGV